MTNQKMDISGVAVRPGISKNGILYSVEELNNFAPTLIGRPILKDHSGNTDDTLGKITSTTNIGDGVVNYSGWIKEDGTGILEKVNDGRISEVSIGAFVKQLVKENDDDEHFVAVGIEAMELSTTPVPAVKGTSLNQTLESLDNFKKDKTVKVTPVFEDCNVFENLPNKVINKTEVINMTEEDKPQEEPEAPVEEPKVEEPAEEKPAEETPEEKPAEDEAPVEEKTVIKQSVKVGVDVDTSKLDESIKKLEKIAELKEKIKDKAENKTHGKVVKEEVEEKPEVESNYVVEASDLGGEAFWKQPKADGRLS